MITNQISRALKVASQYLAETVFAAYNFNDRQDAKDAIKKFYKEWRNDPLVKDTLDAFFKGDMALYEKNRKIWYSVRAGSGSVKDWDAILKATEELKKSNK